MLNLESTFYLTVILQVVDNWQLQVSFQYAKHALLQFQNVT